MKTLAVVLLLGCCAFAQTTAADWIKSLQAENAALKQQNAELQKKYDDLKAAATQAYYEIEAEHEQMNAYIQQLTAESKSRTLLNNSQLIHSLMPPPLSIRDFQLSPLPMSVPQYRPPANVNCRSQVIAGVLYTNCQ